MSSLLLTGVLLPLMATWFIPAAIKKGRKLFNGGVMLNLAIIFLSTIAVHITNKGVAAISYGIINCTICYIGALIFDHFSNSAG